MASILATIRDEVVTAINAGTYSQTVDAVAKHTPTERLEDLTTLTVDVLGRRIERERIGRQVWQRRAVVVVGIQQRLDASERDSLADELLELTDGIAAQLELYAFTAGGLTSITEEPTLHPERLNQHSVFCRVFVLTFSLHEVNT